MTIDIRFTHLGIHVQDPERMAAFYCAALGFVETDRGMLNGRKFIFTSRDPLEHHQLIFVEGLSGPPAETVINQLSFRVPDLESLLAFIPTLEGHGATDIQPANHGNAWSVYFRDPEDNRIEVYTSSPWYILQPCRVPLAIDRTADQIRAETLAWCEQQQGFEPITDFQARVAARIAAANP